MLIKKTALTAILVSVVSTAIAEEVPPAPFAPWQMDGKAAQTLTNALGEIPAKYAIPILAFLAQQEAAAQQTRDRQKPAPKSVPTP